jgi:hypothetical protein
MRRTASFCASLLMAAPVLADDPAAPRFVERRPQRLAVAVLPDLLTRPEVAPHLETGLTTSFALEATVVDEHGGRSSGAARIDLRFEPWDEVFHTVVQVAGAPPVERTLGRPEVAAWWRGLELDLLSVDGLSRGAAWKVRAELAVTPFSHAEYEDAQRWFSDSLRRRAPDEAPTAPGTEPLPGALDVLIATSIRRASLVRYLWRVELQPTQPRQ